MENKFTSNGFVLYTTYWPGLCVLSDADLGKLIKGLFAYHFSGEDQKLDTEATQAIFNLIQERMVKDEAKYVKKCKVNKKIMDKYHAQKHDNQKNTTRRYPNATNINNNIDINNKYNIYLFILEFNRITGKKFKTGRLTREAFEHCIELGYTVQEIYEALRNAMQDKEHIGNGFKKLTPRYILSAENMEYYSPKVIRHPPQGKSPKNILGQEEFIRDGKRYYKYLKTVYCIPTEAEPRPGREYVYDHEAGKWRLPEK